MLVLELLFAYNKASTDGIINILLKVIRKIEILEMYLFESVPGEDPSPSHSPATFRLGQCPQVPEYRHFCYV